MANRIIALCYLGGSRTSGLDWCRKMLGDDALGEYVHPRENPLTSVCAYGILKLAPEVCTAPSNSLAGFYS